MLSWLIPYWDRRLKQERSQPWKLTLHGCTWGDCLLWVFAGSRKMEFKGSSWHESCFVCQYCRQPLGTKPLITKDNENYCVPCFEKQFAHHCYSCKKVIKCMVENCPNEAILFTAEGARSCKLSGELEVKAESPFGIEHQKPIATASAVCSS